MRLPVVMSLLNDQDSLGALHTRLVQTLDHIGGRAPAHLC